MTGRELAIWCARAERACDHATAVAAASRIAVAMRGGVEAPPLNALQQGAHPGDCYGVEVAAAHAAQPAFAARVVTLQCPPVWNKQQMP